MARRAKPIRLLTAVPICDGHDSAITTINLELIRHGVEVIYLGYHRSARDIARAAVQEDVRAIGISSYNGGHVEFFAEVVAALRHYHGADIGLFGGGGGTITPADARRMHRNGVDQIFFPGTSLAEIVAFVKKRYAQPAKRLASNGRRRVHGFDRELAKSLTIAESPERNVHHDAKSVPRSRVIGITGPGGAGKTTLIDELILRFRAARPDARVAVLSHDPSLLGRGALLGDRAAMIHAQFDQVFMRSYATRGRTGGLAPASEHGLCVLRNPPDGIAFDLILVETVGTGQEAAPFKAGIVDRSVLVMNPDYGARLQLQKIVMLDEADVVVINKSDLAGAATASTEIEQRIAANGRGQRLIRTTAKRHRDPGVDELFQWLISD